MNYKSEDFVVGTIFTLIDDDECNENKYKVITRDEALRIANIVDNRAIFANDKIIFYVKDLERKSCNSYIVDNIWFQKYMKSHFGTVVFPKTQKLSLFNEDTEKLSAVFDDYTCPRCNTKTRAVISNVTQALVCLACSQATKIVELKALECGHSGKEHHWYSPAVGIKSGCVDCYLRESPDEL